MLVGPARDIAGGINIRRAGLKCAFTVTPRSSARPALPPSARRGRTPTPMHHKIGGELGAVLERDASRFESADGVAEMENDAMLFMQRADDVAELRAHHVLQRARLRRDHMDLEPAGAQRRRDFQPDEAGADHDHARARRSGARR